MRSSILAIFLCTFSLLSFAQIQQDCGAIDCPGRCGRYIDQNADGFCDHGRISASTATTSTAIESTREEPSVESDSHTTPSEAPKTKKIHTQQTEIPSPTTTDSIVVVSMETDTPVSDTSEQKSPYSLILISSITIGCYLLTSILVKIGRLKKATHRKIWNLLLLVTALGSCLLGFFLVIQINYSMKMDWLWNVKLYHVQFGIAMTIIAVIHILWHINYWRSILKKKQ